MNTLRSKSGKLLHASDDARRTLCSKPCDGWIVVDAKPTCIKCLHAMVR